MRNRPEASTPLVRYLPTTEVAKQLGCSRHTVLRRIRSGELPVVDISTNDRPRFRVTDEALEAFLETRPWMRAAS